MDAKIITRIATIMKIARHMRNGTYQAGRPLSPTPPEVALAYDYAYASMLANVKKSDDELARELNERSRDTTGVPS